MLTGVMMKALVVSSVARFVEYLKMKNIFKIEDRGSDHVHGPIFYGEVFPLRISNIYIYIYKSKFG